jgi:hypothetical protein
MFVTVGEIQARITAMGRTEVNGSEIGKAMVRHGFEKATRDHGKRRGYMVVEYSFDEIERRKKCIDEIDVAKGVTATQSSLPF